MKVAGIDYSMNSPSVCIADSETFDPSDRNTWKSIYTTGKKSLVQANGNILGIAHDKTHYPDDISRFEGLADKIVSFMVSEGVQIAFLEGYSMGSTSNRIFQIAENTAMLKAKIKAAGIPLMILAPKYIKKYATDNGNAKKELMHEHFMSLTGYNINEDYLGPRVQNRDSICCPASDIVDAFFFLKYGIENLDKYYKEVLARNINNVIIDYC